MCCAQVDTFIVPSRPERAAEAPVRGHRGAGDTRLAARGGPGVPSCRRCVARSAVDVEDPRRVLRRVAPWEALGLPHRRRGGAVWRVRCGAGGPRGAAPNAARVRVAGGALWPVR